MFNCTPERHLMFLNSKHLISINDMVTELNDKVQMAAFLEPEKAIAKWEEKIGDAINYLILLEGLVKERIVPNRVEAKSRCESGSPCPNPFACNAAGHCVYRAER